MAKRRDTFIMVPAPGRKKEATEVIASWLQKLDGSPGYLGGSVLHESANELIDDIIVLVMDFDSAEATRATFKQLQETGTGWPFQPNAGTEETEDQGWVLYPNGGDAHDHHDGNGHDHHHGRAKVGAEHLTFDRGEGLLARLMHVHAEVAYEHVPVSLK